MINGNLKHPGVQTIFVSKEQSNCPLIPDIVRFGKKFKDLGVLEDTTAAVVSLKYGKRLLINGSSSNIGDIQIDDILEIVDYNPTKKQHSLALLFLFTDLSLVQAQNTRRL